MKKKVIVTSAVTALMAASFAFGVFAASDIKLIINGKQVNTKVEMINGSSYVPLRVVSESLGADVKWDGAARTITINGGATGSSAATVAASAAKSYDVDVTLESGPMTLKVSKVTLDPAYKKGEFYSAINAVVLDVEVENTSADTVNWHPDQGTIVLNTKEQAEAAMSMLYSDDVSGQFIGNVIKRGKIVIEVKSDVNEITSIKYSVNGPSSAASYKRLGDNKTTEIILK